MRRRWIAVVGVPIVLALGFVGVRRGGSGGGPSVGAAGVRLAEGAAGPTAPPEPPAGPADVAPEPAPAVPSPAPAVLPPAPEPEPPAPPPAPPPAAEPANALDPRAAAAIARAPKNAARRGSDARSTVSLAPTPAPTAPGPTAVVGHVTDAFGSPVPGTIVTAIAWHDRPVGKPATTDGDGAYALVHDGVSDGAPHRVRAEHLHFRPREVGIPPRKADEPATVCDIVLDDGPAKEGHALLEGGVPGAGAVVTVIGRVGETVADRDGVFVLPVLASGVHTVVARLAPHLAGCCRVSIDADGFPLHDAPLELVLREEGSIQASGLETTSPGVGPPTVVLWLGDRSPQGPPPFAVAQPGADGIVRFLGLPTDVRYTVATATPAIGYLSPDPIEVFLEPGAYQEVWLGRRGTALLIVLAKRDSGPPARAVFSAWAVKGGNSIVMSGDASARMEGLPADRYFVFCNDQQGGLGRDYVTLEAGEVRTLELTILKAGRLTGVLVDENGKPAVGAKVTADTAEGGIERQSIVDAEGKFALEMLYPGKQVIRASLDGRTATQTIDVAIGEDKGPIGLALAR